MNFKPDDFMKTVTCDNGLVHAEVHNLVNGARQVHDHFFFGTLSFRLKMANRWADKQIQILAKHTYDPRAVLKKSLESKV